VSRKRVSWKWQAGGNNVLKDPCPESVLESSEKELQERDADMAIKSTTRKSWRPRPKPHDFGLCGWRRKQMRQW
jgi:hypothetical protein